MHFSQIKHLFLFSSIISLSACSNAAETLPPLENWSTVHGIEAAQFIEQNTVLNDADRIVIYENKGLVIEDNKGAPLDALNGHFSILDHRNRADDLVIITEDISLQKMMLVQFSKASNTWSTPRYIPKSEAKIEGACLYQDSTDNLFAFLIGEEGQGEQWLVADSKDPLEKPVFVRKMSLPPASEYCQVDDANARLFINEETVGIWQYDASPEADLTRSPVALTEPYGKLGDVTGGMALVPNGMLVMNPENQSMQAYIEHDGQWVFDKTYPIGDLADAENVVARQNQSSLDLLILHDDGATVSSLLWQHNDIAPSDTIIAIEPDVETTPVPSLGDAADDPAIWVNQQQPSQSLVLATDKKAGLAVYDLNGNQTQFLNVGRINNIDVRHGFKLNGKTIDVAAASNRDQNAIQLFGIAPDNGLVFAIGQIQTPFNDIYGLCMFKDQQGEIYAIANDKDGRFLQYQLINKHDELTYKLRREFSVASQPEGCVADDTNERFFIGEEDYALWTLDARANATVNMEKVMAAGDILHADIEGISLYQQGDHSYLVISSQGNNSYVVLDAHAPYQYRGRFRVGFNAEKGIDGASETDGLDVTSANLGGVWKKGMLVVQDGRNRMPETTQNFKYIAWSKIAEALNLD